MNKGIKYTVALGLLAVAFPFVLPDYYMHILILVLLWITMASAWNLLGGYVGQVSFGHSLFFGLGAYGAGLLYFHFHISTWWGMLVGPIWAMIIAIPVGLITFRLRGSYFNLSMLAISEIGRIIFTNWTSFSNGAVGVMISRTWGRDKLPYYAIMLGITVLTLIVIYLLVHSKFGYYFLSIREDQDAAEALGIPTTKYKMYALLPSAFFTALAGAFFMNYIAYIDPQTVFSLPDVAIMMILCVMLGGAGTLWGPVLGATVYVILAEFFRTVPIVKEVHVLVFSLIVIAIIVFLPDGIIGEWDKVRRVFGKRRSAAVVCPPQIGRLGPGMEGEHTIAKPGVEL